VNAAAFFRYYLRQPEKTLANFLLPALGFAICLLLWFNVGRTALIAGGLMATGRSVVFPPPRQTAFAPRWSCPSRRPKWNNSPMKTFWALVWAKPASSMHLFMQRGHLILHVSQICGTAWACGFATICNTVGANSL